MLLDIGRCQVESLQIEYPQVEKCQITLLQIKSL